MPMGSRHPRTRIVLVVLMLAALLAGVAFAVEREREREPKRAAGVERAPAADAEHRPNIVLVYTDDQNYRDFTRRYMPRTMHLLGDRGTLFTNYVVSTPICCPSRAAAFTGSYPHNNGVFFNQGGWSELRDRESNIASWLQHAGYRTAWFGKFLQGYKQAVEDPSIPAPGFDDWLVTLKPKYYGYKLYTNGPEHTIEGADDPRDYYTDELTRRAVDLIHEHGDERRPLFMILNHLAPHRGEGGTGRCATTVAVPPRDRGRFAVEPLPRPPSFNRVTPADQTAFPSAGGLDPAAIAKERDRNRCRLESLLAADRSVARVHEAFRREGELSNTVFVFTSDNGVVYGQHGLKGKNLPYEEGIHMPLAISAPPRLLGGERVATVDRLVANVDLAPTLLDLAGALPCVREKECRTLDGRSLVPLLAGREHDWAADRAILIEGGDHRRCGFRGLRLERAVVLEAVQPAADGGPGCEAVGTPEYYDLRTDPYQLRNLAIRGGTRDQVRLAELHRRLHELETCAGTSREDGDPDSSGPCE